MAPAVLPIAARLIGAELFAPPLHLDVAQAVWRCLQGRHDVFGPLSGGRHQERRDVPRHRVLGGAASELERFKNAPQQAAARVAGSGRGVGAVPRMALCRVTGGAAAIDRERMDEQAAFPGHGQAHLETERCVNVGRGFQVGAEAGEMEDLPLPGRPLQLERYADRRRFGLAVGVIKEQFEPRRQPAMIDADLNLAAVRCPDDRAAVASATAFAFGSGGRFCCRGGHVQPSLSRSLSAR